MRSKDLQTGSVVHPFAVAGCLGLLILLTLVLAGCGGSGGTIPGSAQPGTPGTTVDHSNDAQLNGVYAFSNGGSMMGSTGGNMMGSLRADGKGHITAGVEDLYTSTTVHVFSNITGTYNVGSDGRGSITLNSSAGVQTVDLVMLSSQHGLFARRGSIDMQNPAAFSLASLTANSYAFALNGAIFFTGGSRFSFTSAGFFSTSASGTIVSGLEDFGPGGGCCPPLPLALSGNIGGVDANGRGTAVLTTSRGTFNYVLYVVDSTHVMLFATDGGVLVTGDAFSRQTSFDNASLPGRLAFVVPFFMGAVFTTDGVGNITGGTADRIEFPNPFSGPPSLLTVGVTGSYSVASNGRGLLTLNDTGNTLQASYVIYPSTAGVFMLQFIFTGLDGIKNLDSTNSMAFQQQPGPFGNSSINGKFGDIEAGNNHNGEASGPFFNLGLLVSDGKGNLSVIQDSPTSPQGISIKGTYSLAPSGRGTAIIGTTSVFIYALSSSRVLFLSTADSDGFWAQQQ